MAALFGSNILDCFVLTYVTCVLNLNDGFFQVCCYDGRISDV